MLFCVLHLQLTKIVHQIVTTSCNLSYRLLFKPIVHNHSKLILSKHQARQHRKPFLITVYNYPYEVSIILYYSNLRETLH